MAETVAKKPKDPLAGRREGINAGYVDSLLWPDRGQGAPVEQGKFFKLRTCHIEITRVHRVQQNAEGGGKRWLWRAEFRRIFPEGGVFLLGKSGKYVRDAKEALTSQDDHVGATLDPIDPDDRSDAHRAVGEPPEPEAVPPHEVGTYTGDALARRRYEHEMAQERHADAEQPLEVRLARLRQLADAKHVDISGEVRVIEKRVEKIEQRLGRAAA